MVQVVSLICCYYNFREKSHHSNLVASVPEYENAPCTALAGPAHQPANAFLHISRVAFESCFLLISYPMLRKCPALQKGWQPLWGGADVHAGHTEAYLFCSLPLVAQALTQPLVCWIRADSEEECNVLNHLCHILQHLGVSLESPTWYYQDLKLSLEIEYNMEWLNAISELLKGFWQKPEEKNKKFTQCWPKPQKHLSCAWRWHKQTQ